MRRWLQPPDRDELLRPIVHFTVLFGGGVLVIYVVVNRVLGITDPDVSYVIVSAYIGASVFLYMCWVMGFIPGELRMTRGRIIRWLVLAAIATGGAILVARNWPGE